jgi:hypothetical protein
MSDVYKGENAGLRGPVGDITPELTGLAAEVQANADQVAADKATAAGYVDTVVAAAETAVSAEEGAQEAYAGAVDLIEDTTTSVESLDARVTTLESRHTPATGDIIEAEIMGPANMPAIATNIPGNGKILRIRFKGIGTSSTVDATKAIFTCIRPGFGTDRLWHIDNIVEQIRITGLYRLAYPNQAVKMMEVVGSDVDTYWAVERSIFVKDRCYNLEIQAGFFGACTTSTIAVIDSTSTRPYEMPQVDCIASPPVWRMPSAGLYSEWAVMHHGARAGQTVAAVEIYVNDSLASPGSGNESKVAVTSMIASTLTLPYKPPVFAGTVPITGLSNGLGGLSIRVFPWISDNAPWELSANGAASVADTSMPAYQPVQIDSDDSYKAARAYVSHTGSLIGSPAISTSALAAYNPGTTAAYASVAALFTAGKTFNNSGSRTRTHNDIDAIEAVLPDGTIIAGFGGDISNQTNYPVGNGPLPRVVAASGANRDNTGITYAASIANKRYRHLEIEGINIVPGTSGTADHTVLHGVSNSTAPTTLQIAVMLRAKNCKSYGSGDALNPVIILPGHRWYVNNDFKDLGLVPMTANYAFYQSIAIHGGTYDWRTSLPNGANGMSCIRMAGARFWQLVPEPENASRTTQYMVGNSYWHNRIDFGGNGSGANPSLGTNRIDGEIGARGIAFCGNLIRQTNSAANEKPSLQIHADFTTSGGTPYDLGPVRNANVWGNTINGGRYNRGYNEVGTTRVIKDFYEYFNATDDWNAKTDLKDTPTDPSGLRTGVFALRFGTDKGYNRNSQTSSQGDTYVPTSWLGEAAAIGDVISIGDANMFVTNAGTYGTNNLASDGDYHPLAALQSAIPAGRAPWSVDINDVAIPNDGTGAAGALQVAP